MLYDVLVKVDQLILPDNFLNLNCEVDYVIPFILSRPFLDTERAIVDMKCGKMKF